MPADGIYTLGASIVPFSLTHGFSPVVATLLSLLCFCPAGLVTGFLHI
ncbi:hypothetical protein [Clostridioides difficile]|nr:hypothetical protein [Clostridioides difficile]